MVITNNRIEENVLIRLKEERPEERREVYKRWKLEKRFTRIGKMKEEKEVNASSYNISRR